jgi:hypothetical protein
MTTVAWLVLILVCGFVWGGFLTLLLRALRAEDSKVRGRGPSP